MPRRITVPDDHVAVVLPNQCADELAALLINTRLRFSFAAWRNAQVNAGVENVKLRDTDQEQAQMHQIAGDVMLALLEAREA